MLRLVDHDPDNPRWLRTPRPQLPLLKVPTHWAVRLAWIVAQTTVFCSLTWVSLGQSALPPAPITGPQQLFFALLLALALTALLFSLVGAS